MKKGLLFSFVLLLVISATGIAQTETQNTTVIVRALAKDAKFIGSSMGGAYITIREVKSGDLLADGYTSGSTGDTDKLVRNPHKRYEKFSTTDAAQFEAAIPLENPTFVEVTARGPMAQKQSAVSSSTQLWLLPGKDITGDGIVLEVPGFAIDILEPQAHEFRKGDQITITANAVMMCGCPTSPDGLWDSNAMEFTAIVSKNGEEVARQEMTFTGKTSTYETTFTPEESGAYQITVYGYDPRTGNTGLDKTTVITD